MPELPEVETVRRGLEPVLKAARFVRVEQRRADLRFPFPEHFSQRLVGQTVTSVARRSKYILAHLSGGEVLIVHLGMTGRLSVAHDAKSKKSSPVVLGEYVYDAGADPKHDHAVLHLDNGASVTYNDPRRFGFMLLAEGTALDQHPLMRGLGVEPLSANLTPEYIAKRAYRRKTDAKAFLMDQRNVAGLGNIYVCEALFRCGVSPLSKSARFAGRAGRANERSVSLVPAIHDVLNAALAAGGSTLRDYRHADGESGQFQEEFRVYGREGEACVRPGCTGTVRRSVQSNRSTFWCPKCQK